MSGEIENTARSMMSSPQGLKIIKGLDHYNAAMNTPAGRQLIDMIAGSGSDALKAAARAAQNASRDPGRALLQNLLSSKDGTAMAAKVIEVLGI
ncbi:MAG: hypothetical protein II028_05645 [Clostridia bacterium]|jgi:hypothetical protein|nr:hypothetical protein [Clostridia bacterium]